jgi:hypothetical protein
MKLSGNNELIVIGVLILYIAFTPGFPVVRQLLSTGFGKAVGLGVIVYVYKYVSEPVALLLLVNFVRCASMREYMTNVNAHCPAPYTLSEGNTCKDDKGNQGPPATICLPGQTWDGSKCAGSSTENTAGIAPTTLTGPTGNTAGASMPSTPSVTGATGMRQPFTNYGGGYQPNASMGGNYAPAK